MPVKHAWPSVSFVVPLFNQLEHTQAMLASLMQTMPDGLAHEIILADDASSDSTGAWLSGLSQPHIKVVRNAVNCGYAATNNLAARCAKGEVLALLNNDLLLRHGWLEPMLDTLMSPYLHAGAVGNLQRRVADNALDHAGIQMTEQGHLSHVQQIGSQMHPRVKRIAVTGACMLLRARDFWACGGFDEHFVNGGEDVDLCFKIRDRGLHIYVATQSCVLHHVSLSRGTGPSLNSEKNSRLLFSKWRKCLKHELAGEWWKILTSGDASSHQLEKWVERELLATPCLASLRIAEAILCAHEHRWNELLGQFD